MKRGRGQPGAPASLRPIALLLFVVSFLTSSFFTDFPSDYFQGGWNQKSRFDLTRAIVEQGTIRIDAYQENTGDKATRGGHYYSDKAPGLALLAVPFYAPVYAVEKWVAPDIARQIDPVPVFNLWWVTVWTVCLPSALLLAVMFLWLAEVTGNARAALWAAIAYGFGTLAFPYGSLFLGHQTAAALAFLAFYLAYRAARTGKTGHTGWAGILAALAFLVDYVAGVLLVVIPFYLWIKARNGAARYVASFLAAFLPGVLLLLIYNAVAFGGPLNFSYHFLARPEFQAGQSQGFFGVQLPKPGVAVALLVGFYRGLLFFSPAWFWAFAGLRKKGGMILEGWFGLAIFCIYWLINAGYYQWDGGSLPGPRHMIIGLPFLAFGLAAALAAGVSKAFQWMLGVSVANVVVTRLVLIFPDAYKNPLFDVAYFRSLIAGAWPLVSEWIHTAPLFNLLALVGVGAAVFLTLRRADRPLPGPRSRVRDVPGVVWATLYAAYFGLMFFQSDLAPDAVRLNLGWPLKDEKRFQESYFNESYFNTNFERLQKNPEDPDANGAIGIYYYAHGEYAKALPYLRKTVEAGVAPPDLYRIYVQALIAGGDREEAKKMLKEFLRRFPDDPRAPDARSTLDRLESEAP